MTEFLDSYFASIHHHSEFETKQLRYDLSVDFQLYFKWFPKIMMLSILVFNAKSVLFSRTQKYLDN